MRRDIALRLSLVLPLALAGCVKKAVLNSFEKQGEEAKANAKPIASTATLPAEKPEKFPFEIWDRVVKAYVDGNGQVDYQGLQKNRGDLELYVAYVNKYSPETNPELFPTKQDKEAYYINAYNSAVFMNVLDKYAKLQETKSVYKIVKPFFYESIFVFGGKKDNLYDLENKLIRPTFKDPRIHFALNCASESCPRLPAEAFTGELLDQQLDRETKKFVSEDRNVRVDGDTLMLSQIFEFYTDDFVEYEKGNGGDASSKEAALVSYINRYRPADKKLPATAAKKVKFIQYDWTPNDQALKK
jgi:hypothetical protein